MYRTLLQIPKCGAQSESGKDFFETHLRIYVPGFGAPLCFTRSKDHSLQETAALTGISVSATRSRVFHAKTALRKSKVLRKIDEPRWHGLHTRLDLKRGGIKEQEKNNV
jgi:hypothetical protein